MLVLRQGCHIKGQNLRQLILYSKNIFRFIRPIHVHFKTDKVDFKKSPREKKIAKFFNPLIKQTCKTLSNVTKTFLAISMLQKHTMKVHTSAILCKSNISGGAKSIARVNKFKYVAAKNNCNKFLFFLPCRSTMYMDST